MPRFPEPRPNSKETADLPTPFPASLLLGHLLRLAHDPRALLESLHSQGDTVRIRLGPQEIHVICDPHLAHRFLRDDGMFDKASPFFDQARDGIGIGLTTCQHPDYRQQRPRGQSAFHRLRMPIYAKVMPQQVDQISASRRQGDRDALAETRRIAFGEPAACSLRHRTLGGVRRPPSLAAAHHGPRALSAHHRPVTLAGDALVSVVVSLLATRPATREDIPHPPADTNAVKDAFRALPARLASHPLRYH